MLKNYQNHNAWWEQFKLGDRNAFAAIYSNHIQSLLAYGSRISSDQELIKDNIQDLFVELWNTRENLGQVECLKFYLIKALRYKLIRAKQIQERHFAHFPGAGSDQNTAVINEMPIETEMIEKESRVSQSTSIRKAIDILSKRQQEAILLRFYEGFTNRQIADLLDMHPQSVSNLLYASLVRMKKNLKSSIVFATGIIAALHFCY
jgi:RNA polymerase sigma factor (sigma-70 family)